MAGLTPMLPRWIRGLRAADPQPDSDNPVATEQYVAANAPPSSDDTLDGVPANLTGIADGDHVVLESGLLVPRSITDIKDDLALTAGDVGLGNVNNTSDAGKPVSTAQQAALDLKANDSAVMHNTGNESESGTKTRAGKQFITASSPSGTSGRTIVLGSTASTGAGIGRASSTEQAVRFETGGVGRVTLLADQFAVAAEIAAYGPLSLRCSDLTIDQLLYYNTETPIRIVTADSIGNTYLLPTETDTTGAALQQGIIYFADIDGLLSPGVDVMTLSAGDGYSAGNYYGSLNGVWNGTVDADDQYGFYMAFINRRPADPGAIFSTFQSQGFDWSVAKIGEFKP